MKRRIEELLMLIGALAFAGACLYVVMRIIEVLVQYFNLMNAF